ncbi:hypothetical protein [Oceanobacillus jeddahense]|uniref:Uncharacterized protein n=1 Tax=Oceanobacillus jeddahense TaxID=1462527 RepID=A0ABY5JRX8_9BACI|nr:hypothetical protein [Oceanobacillus jeddahense]UUI02984.1 hypothetical protein NP439_23635 [Oceanobacillus jeddahense]
MSKKHKRETFDEMEQVKSPPFKNIGLLILLHGVAFLYVYIWELILGAS